MNNNRLQLISGVAIILIAAALLLFVVTRRQTASRPTTAANTAATNPFRYSVEDYKAVDPSLISHTEAPPILLEMAKPAGVAIDRERRIHIVGDTQWKVYASDRKRMLFTHELPQDPACIATVPQTSSEFIIGFARQAVRYRLNGETVTAYPDCGDNAIITSIAATDNAVYVADAGNQLIWRFSHEGQVLGKIDEPLNAAGVSGFVLPSPYFDIAPDYGDAIWVANTGFQTLESYSANGQLRTSWGQGSMTIEGFCGCCNPVHFAVFSNGSFVTVEKGLPRVKIYAPTGQFLSVVAGPASFDEGAAAMDVAAGYDNEVYVIDPLRRQLRVFIPLKSKEPVPKPASKI